MTTITVINFAIYLSFLSIEYMFHVSDNHDLLGLKAVPITQKMLAEYDFGAPCKKASKPIDILRQAAIKVKTLMILTKAAKIKVKETYSDNPLIYQYFYLLFVFVYMNFVVFFWISGHRNPNYRNEKGLDKFIFSEDELKLHNANSYKNAQNYLQSTYAQIFYLLNVIYLTLSVQQIRTGKKLMKTNIINFRNIIKKIKFKTFMALPLVREVTTTFEYCVYGTCLKFTDFMLVNDLKAFMNVAKLKHLTNSLYPTGQQISRKIRLGIMFSVVNVLIISLVIPLYLFSNPKTSSAFKVESGSLKIDLVDKSNQKIGTLFKTDKFSGNRNFNQTKGSKDREEIERLWKKYPQLNRFSGFQFQKITLNKYSDIYLDFTPKILEELSTYLRGDKKAKIHVNLTMKVKTLKN